jgi:hypothetical protein
MTIQKLVAVSNDFSSGGCPIPAVQMTKLSKVLHPICHILEYPEISTAKSQ